MRKLDIPPRLCHVARLALWLTHGEVAERERGAGGGDVILATRGPPAGFKD